MKACQDCGAARAPGRSRCYPCYRVNLNKAKPVAPSGPRILYLDIETELHTSMHFGMWNVNINPSLIVKPGRVMCFSAKWQDGKNEFYSKWQHGEAEMVARAWEMLNEADYVVHYYGTKFDIPHLNTEFAIANIPPPAPFKQVDLKTAVSKNLMFPSNKLQYVSTALGYDGKHKTDVDLWVDTMAGKPKAQKYMEKYNRQDVDLLEELYHRLLPWIPSLPNRNLWDGKGCVACGSANVERDGVYRTALSKFDRFCCFDCGKWMRSSKRTGGVTLQGAVL